MSLRQKSGIDRDDESIQVILLGKTGSGKSALGNNLVGTEVFESRLSASPVTKSLRIEKTRRFSHELVIVDTPDFTVDLPHEEYMYNPAETKVIGPHALLFVTSVGEDPESLEENLKTFFSQCGDNVMHYMVIVFTREHDLVLSMNYVSKEEYLENLIQPLKDIISQCRYMFVDNTARDDEKEEKLKELVRTIKDMKNKNQPQRFDYTENDCSFNDFYEKCSLIK